MCTPVSESGPGRLVSRPAAATTLRTMRSRCSSLTAITPRIIEKS